MTNALQDFKKELGYETFGVEVAKYIEDGVCVCCMQPNALTRCHSPEGEKDFNMMGICEECYDNMFLDSERYADELPDRDFFDGDSPDY